MRKIASYFDRGLRILLTSLAIAMIILGFMQVIFRYVLKMPLTWSEELIRYMFVWTTFLGVPIGIERGIHASFDILRKKIHGSLKKPYEVFLLLLAAAIFFIFIRYGFPFAFKNLNQLTPAMKIPYTYVILAVPVGGAIGMLYVTKNIAVLFAKGGES